MLLLFPVLSWLNRLVCRVMFGVREPNPAPLPPSGPVLLVSDHTSLGDPMVLLATAGRPVVFLMAEEIYARPMLTWVFRAFRCIPVRRGARDIGAIRAMVKALEAGEAVGIFPEGGIDRYRETMGYAGVGYLALKTGAPVVPASVQWARPRPRSIPGTLASPCQAQVRYGEPLAFPKEERPTSKRAREVTNRIMEAIARVRAVPDDRRGGSNRQRPSNRPGDRRRTGRSS